MPSPDIELKAGDFDWLLGNWKRTNDAEGQTTFENWNSLRSNEYVGLGFTMQNGDTIKQESIRLINTDGDWNLIVKSPEDEASTIFKITEWNEREFICENQEIEFPNKIRYWKDGVKIKATVSNPEVEIPFEFVRIGG